MTNRTVNIQCRGLLLMQDQCSNPVQLRLPRVPMERGTSYWYSSVKNKDINVQNQDINEDDKLKSTEIF